MLAGGDASPVAQAPAALLEPMFASLKSELYRRLHVDVQFVNLHIPHLHAHEQGSGMTGPATCDFNRSHCAVFAFLYDNPVTKGATGSRPILAGEAE